MTSRTFWSRAESLSLPLLVGLVLALTVFQGFRGAAVSEISAPLPAAFAVVTLDGRSVTAGDLLGKAALLHFWSPE